MCVFSFGKRERERERLIIIHTHTHTIISTTVKYFQKSQCEIGPEKSEAISWIDAK